MRKRAVFSFLLIYFCAFSLISCPPLPVTCSLSYAAVPHLINYQGKLTDSSGTALNGSYNITFRIYDAETAGNLLWQEQYTGVVIQKGIFGVLLGSITALDLAFDKQYYLAIQVGSDPEMSPRQRITSAAYAIRAEQSEKATNADKAKETDAVKGTDNIIPGSGNVGLGTLTPAAKLDVNGSLKIGSGGSVITKIQNGKITFTGTYTGTINFPAAFDSPPAVFISPVSSNSTLGFGIAVFNVTKTGFSWTALMTDYCCQGWRYATGLYWLAIGN